MKHWAQEGNLDQIKCRTTVLISASAIVLCFWKLSKNNNLTLSLPRQFPLNWTPCIDVVHWEGAYICPRSLHTKILWLSPSVCVWLNAHCHMSIITTVQKAVPPPQILLTFPSLRSTWHCLTHCPYSFTFWKWLPLESHPAWPFQTVYFPLAACTKVLLYFCVVL